MTGIYAFVGGYALPTCPDDPFDGQLGDTLDPELASIMATIPDEDPFEAPDPDAAVDSLIASTTLAIKVLEDYRLLSTDEADEMYAALIDALPVCYRDEVYQ